MFCWFLNIVLIIIWCSILEDKELGIVNVGDDDNRNISGVVIYLVELFVLIDLIFFIFF